MALCLKCKRRFKKTSISKYEIFIKVAETGSLTLAGQALGTTQSNVSHALSALEEELGFRLFDRGKHGARLTPEGEQVRAAVKQVVDSEANLMQTAAGIRGLESGKVRIAAFSSVAVHWLPGILKGFAAAYPKIKFQLLNGDYNDVDEWLQAGLVDVAFVRLPSASGAGCKLIPLYDDPLLAVLPPDHEKAGYASFPMKEVEGENFISLLSSSDHDSIRVLREAGLEPNVRFTTKDDYAILAMVENGLGISIMPELLLKGHTDGIRVLPLDPPATRTIALALPEIGRNSPAAARFAEFTEQWVQKNAGNSKDA